MEVEPATKSDNYQRTLFSRINSTTKLPTNYSLMINMNMYPSGKRRRKMPSKRKIIAMKKARKKKYGVSDDPNPISDDSDLDKAKAPFGCDFHEKKIWSKKID
mmetsp:Transcript_2968/g.4275  ORF Transcript_2968/g.4275 Transcript_2968/m.4275 type:complete len:103 (+) Transcript_2968:796-1104(+)